MQLVAADEEVNSRLGIWWFEDSLEKRMPGNLLHVSSTEYRLEVLADFAVDQRNYARMILGEAHGELYSLVECNLSKTKNWFAGSVSSIETWSVQQVLHRGHLESDDEPFDTISFSVQGAQDWSRVSGITKSYTQQEGNPELEFVFSRQPPDPILLTLDSFTLKVRSVLASPSKPWSASLEEDTLIEVRSVQPLTLTQWRDSVIVPLRCLIQFATKTGGSVHRAAIAASGEDNMNGLERRRRWILWSARWMKEYPYEPKSQGFEKPVFFAKDVANIPEALPKWMALFERTKEPMTSYLDLSLGAPSLEYRFFAASRLLERLLGRGSMAKNKLEKLMDKWRPHVVPLNSHPQLVPGLAQQIMDSRNCFAHHRVAECKAAVTGYHLACLDALVRTLIDCEVCATMGFPEDTVPNAIKDMRQNRLAKGLPQFFI